MALFCQLLLARQLVRWRLVPLVHRQDGLTGIQGDSTQGVVFTRERSINELLFRRATHMPNHLKFDWAYE